MIPRIFVIGTNQKLSSLTELESLFPGDNSLLNRIDVLNSRLKCLDVTEKVIFLTCNRMEVYGVALDPDSAIKQVLTTVPFSHYYTYLDQEAVKHLFTVACGSDSIIIGEFEILGQLKKAYQIGLQTKSTGPLLNQLFRDAVNLGKKVRYRTDIGSGATSISYASFNLALLHIKEFSIPRMLVVGAGEIARQVIRDLARKTQLTIINRTFRKSMQIARKYKVEALRIENIREALENTDIVVTATSASFPIITKEMVKNAIKNNKSKLCLIDLGMPRNVDPIVGTIKNIHLYNLDDVQKLIIKNRKIRKGSINTVRKFIDKEVFIYWRWYLSRKLVPIFTALKKHADSIQSSELKIAMKKLHHLPLSVHDKKVISALSTRITNKILAAPFENLKQMACNDDKEEYTEMIRRLFKLN